LFDLKKSKNMKYEIIISYPPSNPYSQDITLYFKIKSNQGTNGCTSKSTNKNTRQSSDYKKNSVDLCDLHCSWVLVGSLISGLAVYFRYDPFFPVEQEQEADYDLRI
jgi:hypothetical protein